MTTIQEITASIEALANDLEASRAKVRRQDERIACLAKMLQEAFESRDKYRAEAAQWRDACVELQELAD